MFRRIWFHPRQRLGFHLNEVRISSLLCNDFITPGEKERTFSNFDLFSLFCFYWGWDFPIIRLTVQMRCLQFCQSTNSSLKTQRFALGFFRITWRNCNYPFARSSMSIIHYSSAKQIKLTSSLFTLPYYFPKNHECKFYWKVKREKVKILNAFAFRIFGAGGGTWTRTVLPPTDFESVTSAIPSHRLIFC